MELDSLLCPISDIDDVSYAKFLDTPCYGYLQDSQFFAVEAGNEKPAVVQSVDHGILRYSDHINQYLEPNRPVLIQGLGCTWHAWKDWRNVDGGIEWDVLKRLFGDSTVQASSVSIAGTDCNTRQLKFAQFCDQSSQASACPQACKIGESAPYVKDWHLAAEYPHYKAYSCPPYFADDWLNSFLLHKQRPATERSDVGEADPSTAHKDVHTADYRFVYVGVQGSRTLLHADVVRSFSWSINISGRKRWLLLPPQHTHLAMDSAKLNLSPSLECDEVSHWEQRFPSLQTARAKAIEVIQGAGEALFVPSGWTHSVENLEDTISVNHNWLNGFNVLWSANLLCHTFLKAVELLYDCRERADSVADFLTLVDRMVLADAGFSFKTFTDLLFFVIDASMHKLDGGGVLV